jgi:hypothetical protein
MRALKGKEKEEANQEQEKGNGQKMRASRGCRRVSCI